VVTTQQAITSPPIENSRVLDGFRRVWADYPRGQSPDSGGLVAFPLGASSAYTPALSSDLDPEFLSGFQPELSDPGHSLVQESFFVCSVKGFGDVAGLGDVYIEIVVDVTSGMAFARVCASPSPVNAVNFLRTGVLPFYQRHGERIERVLTRNSREFCGWMPTHPYELFLASSKIEHVLVGPGQDSPGVLCLQLYRILRRDFFAPELRKSFRHSFSTLQRDLDTFLASYNRERAVPDGSHPSRTPFRPILEERSAPRAAQQQFRNGRVAGRGLG